MPLQDPQENNLPIHIYILIFGVAIVTAVGVGVYNNRSAEALVSNPDTTRRISSSIAFARVVDESVKRAFQSGNSELDLDSLLLGSELLQSLINQAVTDRLLDYGRSPEFQNSVSLALPQERKPESNAGLLKQIQSKMKLYETNLAQVTRQVNDDESVQAVNELQSNFVELQQLISGLSQEMRCSLAMVAGGKSSYLLKEKRSTQLQVYKIVVTLGALKKDLIDSVTISSPNAGSTQANTRVIGNVRLGSTIRFQSEGRSYESTFTFRQARFGPDFVGFEVQEILVPGKECLAGV